MLGERRIRRVAFEVICVERGLRSALFFLVWLEGRAEEV